MFDLIELPAQSPEYRRSPGSQAWLDMFDPNRYDAMPIFQKVRGVSSGISSTWDIFSNSFCKSRLCYEICGRNRSRDV
jgi:hypothetical protein